MRVACDIQNIRGKKTGYGFYLQNLLEGFEEVEHDLDWQFIDKVKKDLRTPQRMWWDQVGLCWQAWKKRPDLLFVPYFSAPMMYPGKKVMVVHDLVASKFAQHYSKTALAYWNGVLPASAKRVDHIITISENTKQDLVNELKIKEDKITVIPLAVNKKYKVLRDEDWIEETLEGFGLKNNEFVLSVSTLEPRKNYERLIKAFAGSKRREEKLVIVGKKGWGYEPIFDLVNKMNLKDSVIFLDYVKDNDLLALYNTCKFFVMPSLYEGFGLPPLEAMACGAPVIVSNRSSLPEVVGEAAMLVDPYSVEDMQEKMNILLRQREIRKELEEKSLEQAAKFSWKKTAEETLKIFRKVVNEK